MNRLVKALGSIGVAVSLTACYHATIDTGRPPSPQTLERPWALGFIYGLVPPPIVETASRCPTGVSKVETVHSFLNQLVQFVTFGIVTPMTIKVTCAAGAGDDTASTGTAVRIEMGNSMEQKQRELTEAVWRSAEVGQPIWVVFQ